MTTFYRYRQNNSGGSFLSPALEVFVEADSPREADERAEFYGDIYFDDDYSIDCDCCGTRWSRASEWDAVDEDNIKIPYMEYDEWADRAKIPVRKFIRKD